VKQFLVISTIVLLSLVPAKANQEKVRNLVHTLDYIARDYQHAIANGNVKDADEYAEMQEFSEALTKQITELQFTEQDSTSIAINSIKKLISEKADATIVSAEATALRQKLIAHYGINTAPALYPDIANGKNIFKAHCAACHGENGAGDGPEGIHLKPAPRNFHDDAIVGALSPFAIFNTVRVGIEGTGMVANTSLSEKEVWDVAFYVLALRYNGKKSETVIPEISLDEIAVHSDNTFKEKGWSAAQIQQLRNRLPQEANNIFLSRTEKLLKEALAAYENADYKTAERLAISAYLEGVEPVEIHLSNVNTTAAKELEDNVTEVRLLMKKNAPVEEVKAAVEKAIRSVGVASAALENNNVSFWMAFSITLIILLREGLEAFLVIMVLLAILDRSNLGERKKYIHLGWISAIAIGVVIWIVSGKAIQSSITNMELMEGIIALVAVSVLIYVGFWLHSKSKAEEWKKYVGELVAKANSNKSVWGLAALAFFVSFREVFESLLFLSALQIQSKGTQTAALGTGIVAAGIIVLALAFISHKYSAKLPVQKLFQISAFTISVLAFVLAGKGMHSFQEAGFVSIHKISSFPVIEILGIYNTIETLSAQAVVFLLIIALRWLSSKK